MKKIVTFIKYNNLTAIIFSVVFGGMSVSLAASPTVRSSVYASSQTVKSVDNKLILSANLDAFDFNLKINSVTEDADSYYATYSYKTLSIENGVWKNINVTKTFQVAKVGLNGKDFGVYLGKQLADNMNAELGYLKRVQAIEKKKGPSNKVIATEYSGLVGKMLDPNEKVIAGYVPVIPEIIEESSMANVVESLEDNQQPESDSNVRHLAPGPSLVINEAEIKRLVNEYLAAHSKAVVPNVPLQSDPVNPVPLDSIPAVPTPTPDHNPTPVVTEPTPVLTSTPETIPAPTPTPTQLVPTPTPTPTPDQTQVVSTPTP